MTDFSTHEHAILVPNPWRWIFNALLTCLAAGLALYVLLQIDNLMWDFKTYYYAALAYKVGLDPYHLGTLRGLADTGIIFNYVYPPLTLALFIPFTWLPYNTAAAVFVVSKLGALAVLVLLWNRAFLKQFAGPLFYCFLLLAFNATLYRDIEAGNISIFEMFLLWWSFYFFKNKRYTLFCLICVIAAAFKVFPLLFVGLLLWTDDRQKWFHLTGAVFLFGCMLALSWYMEPEFFPEFLNNAWGSSAGVGVYNPSFMALCRDILTRGASLIGWTVPPQAVIGAALIWAAFCVGNSFLTVRRAKMIGTITNTSAIYLGCLTFALIHPRFKDYAYILLIVPAYEVIREFYQRYASPRVLGVVACIGLYCLCMVPIKSPLPGMQLMFEYTPFFLALGLWLMASHQLRTLPDPQRRPETVGETIRKKR